MQDVGLAERDVWQRAVFLLRPLEHVGGKVCREKRPAALGDGAGEQSRAAGAFEPASSGVMRELTAAMSALCVSLLKMSAKRS